MIMINTKELSPFYIQAGIIKEKKSSNVFLIEKA